ncbi:unnamed protein product [Sympodiomycopsis kandeliae]
MARTKQTKMPKKEEKDKNIKLELVGGDEPETSTSTSTTTTTSSPKKRKKTKSESPPFDYAEEWKDAHQTKLNKAITQIALENIAQIVKLEPDLLPWTSKSRLHPKVKQLMRSAQFGKEAAKLLEKEVEGTKKKVKKVSELVSSHRVDG